MTNNDNSADSEIVQKIIEKYEMLPHPEGGYFKETYRSEGSTDTKKGSRNFSTAIFFLITPGSVSRMHKIESDELWHFYLGGPMTIIEASKEDGVKKTVLGSDVLNGELVQYTVKAGTWFGSFPNEGSSFSFVGCTVAPGFDFEDFELGSRAKLLAEFPDAKDVINKLTEGLP
eukprot:CAMPEP_0178954562 /NCGR_PEP_ID=MMETSP0789-20121207/9065_1 /TAXON_ID=3005 /ORGANISM="Rhizosolenia setigera, Strain CCMP 1694" /LENGTH=172 /DNA_ID=CAMNT_0020635989 /DNA_START=266 /DNA_END=784 /DNA_ORIENTATION=+